MYLSIIFLPLLGCIASGFFGRKVGVDGARLITSLSVIITTILAILGFFEIGFNNLPVTINLFRWIDSEWFNIIWGFQFDSLTVSMLIPVLIISSLVHIYSISYMGSDPHNQRFFSYLSLFTFMMIILVTANNYLLMFVGWEGVGVCSYLLVSFWFTRIAANQSSISAFLANRVGDCFVIIGMFAILWSLGNLDYSTVFSLAPYINSNVVLIIGICLLIGAMAKSVRWWALFWNGDIISKHWSNMFLTTKLGGGETPKLNIAFSHNEGIRSNHGDRLALLVKFSKIKTILFEVHLPVVSSHGLQRAWDRLNAANLFLELLDRVMACPQTNCINNFKVESEQSKENKIQNIWRSGLPKTRNSYGNRGVVLPLVYYNNIYCPLKNGTRGRTLDFNFRMLSTSAGSPVQIKSNTNDKLLKLAEHCKKKINGQIQMDKLYRLMYDSTLYELAYKKLGASSGGNINLAGVNINPLDHNHHPLVGSAEVLSEVIEGIIAELKDCSFRFDLSPRTSAVYSARPKGGKKVSLTRALGPPSATTIY